MPFIVNLLNSIPETYNKVSGMDIGYLFDAFKP